MKYCFKKKKFTSLTMDLIDKANEIISHYQAQGYSLTLRQLYYQFVSRALIENSQKSYKRIGSIINDGRLAGLIDWNAIEDRTRVLHDRTDWNSPQVIIKAAKNSYHVNRWRFSRNHVEVWVEKEALVEVVGRAAHKFDVPYMACKGYPSQSIVFQAARRFVHIAGNLPDELEAAEKKKMFTILYLGDHDPSGIDITRDIDDRLMMFGIPFDVSVNVIRIALNMDQVEEYDPPPNPAKLTDSRCQGYIEQFGNESWELDALEPAVIDDLISEYLRRFVEDDAWQKAERLEKQGKELIDGAIEWIDEQDGE